MKLKRIGFAVMAAVMLLSFLSANVFAETKTGKCGDSVTWELTDSGVLTISGSGDMYNVEYNAETYTSYEWIDNVYEVSSISIGSGITGIGSYSFEALSDVTGEIVIPEGVTKIGMGAFTMTGITSIKLPSTLTKIGEFAFMDCPIETVYYAGTAEDFAKITIGEENNELLAANIVYASSSENVAPATATAPTPATAVSIDGISVIVNGSSLSFDQPPVIINGRTLVPLRAIFEALGAEVDWDAEAKQITAYKDSVAILLTVDSTEMIWGAMGVNANFITLDTAPTIINGRTMVPARAIAESFKCDVNWDSSTKTVIITG